MDGRQWMNVYGWTLVDGCQWMEGAGQTLTKVERNGDGRQTEQRRTKRMAIMTDCDDTVEQSTSVSSVPMACGKKKRNFFLLLHVFFFFFFFFFFSRVATRATHYMTTSSKTHKSA
jgi:hypothetical protein